MSVVASIPDHDWLELIGEVDGVELVHWDLTQGPPRDDVELVVPPYMANPRRLEQLQQAPRLRAVQLVTAGYEHALAYLPDGVQLANGAGIHDTSTAELALALTLAAQRGLPDFVRAQQRGEWLHAAGLPSLADRRVTLVGYGSVGRTIVRRLLAFETTVRAVASSARAGDELVDRVHGIDDLPDLLPDTEVLVLITPLTASTRGLVGAEVLAALPDGALVVNVARGPVVDTDALLAECRSGRLRAALDVTDPEPLPADHPLWSCPGVLVSPHVGGASSAFVPRAVAFLRRELAAYAAGEGLSHVRVVGGVDA